jgi:predicted small metal-binding protein
MAVDNSLRCDCGYRLRGRDEHHRLREVRRHAWEAHRISFSTEEALAVLSRLEREATTATVASSDEPTSRRERQ